MTEEKTRSIMLCKSALSWREKSKQRNLVPSWYRLNMNNQNLIPAWFYHQRGWKRKIYGCLDEYSSDLETSQCLKNKLVSTKPSIFKQCISCRRKLRTSEELASKLDFAGIYIRNILGLNTIPNIFLGYFISVLDRNQYMRGTTPVLKIHLLYLMSGEYYLHISRCLIQLIKGLVTTYQPICQNKINFNYGVILTADLAEIHISHIQKSHFKSLGLGERQEQQQAPLQGRNSSKCLQGRKKGMQPGMKMWNPLGYQRRTTQLIIEMPNAWKIFQTISKYLLKDSIQCPN